ncbi:MULTISPECIES: GNAT family N-acetyltransferase [Rhodomicrobium]|uniref:GNAT family N-acetyltransferase n=1 Tax=Rhodomicrobium TaxID=1068 RepID=UPI000B4B396B|nr:MULTISPECIES: GNAT family N-acetyltransferase [Rhodomicrobium]
MTPVLETARLVLRPLRLADAAATQTYFPHWDVVKYLNARLPWPYPEDGALQFYRDGALPAVARGEKWIWAILLKGGPEHLIGAIELTRAQNDNRAFWLGVPWHGQGLMTEACAPVTDFWFEVLGEERLVVCKAAPNLASRRISEQQNARLIGTEERDYVSGRLPSEIWELTRELWRARER